MLVRLSLVLAVAVVVVPHGLAAEQEKPKPLTLEKLAEILSGVFELHQYEDNELLHKEKAEQYAASLEEYVGEPVELDFYVSRVALGSTVLSTSEIGQQGVFGGGFPPILFTKEELKRPVQFQYGASITKQLVAEQSASLRGAGFPSGIVLPHEGNIALEEAKQLRQSDQLRVSGTLTGIVIGSLSGGSPGSARPLEMTFVIRPDSAERIESKGHAEQE